MADVPMGKWLLIVIAALLPPAVFAGNGDECLYDQGAFRDMLRQLSTQYPSSRFAEDNEALVIPVKDGTVTVSYSGCEDYGTDVTYVAAAKGLYSRKDAFAKATELARQFGQGRIDAKKLRTLLEQNKYEEVQAGVFAVEYPGMDEFTIEIDQDSGRSKVHIGFYN